MTLGASTEDPILGKAVSELQSDLAVSGDDVSVKVKPVTDYTEFSSKPEEQDGYFMAFNIAVDGADAQTETTVTMTRNGSTAGTPAKFNGATENCVFILGKTPAQAKGVNGISVVSKKGTTYVAQRTYDLTVTV